MGSEKHVNLRSIMKFWSGASEAPTDHTSVSLVESARVLLLVGSVAVCWLGLFGVLSVLRIQTQTGAGLFGSYATSLSVLIAGLCLIAAQLRLGGRRLWAGLAVTLSVLGQFLGGQMTPLLTGGVTLAQVAPMALVLVTGASAWALPKHKVVHRGWPSRVALVLTIIGTLFSVAGATWLMQQEAHELDRQTQARTQQLAGAMEATFSGPLDGLERLTKRWSSAAPAPSFGYRDLEFSSFLAERPQVLQIVSIDDGLSIVHSRQNDRGNWAVLEDMLAQPQIVATLSEIETTGKAQWLDTKQFARAQGELLAAAAWRSYDDSAGIVLITLRAQDLVEGAFNPKSMPCCLQVRVDGAPVYSSLPNLSEQTRFLGRAQFEPTGGSQHEVLYWHDATAAMQASERFATLFLLLGLTFTFFVIYSHRLSHVARVRAQEVQYRALHDSVTRLPNRQMLEATMPQHWEGFTASDERVHVLLVALENLRLINDSIGHDLGDALLFQVAQRLQVVLPEHALLARVDGGEFAVFVPGLVGTKSSQLAADVIETVGRPIQLGSHLLRMSAVVGITVSNTQQMDVSRLLREADLAMLQARRNGQNTWAHYTSRLGEQVTQQISLQSDLSNALTLQQFSLCYQPIIDGTTGAIVGIEALMRWQHPTAGRISPLQFIPMAEESGQIVVMTQWVLMKAARDAQRINRTAKQPIGMAVNISTVFFQRTDFIQRIRSVLTQTQLPAHLLEIEITENVLLKDVPAAISKLQTLKALGVSVSLDDFGTGYSSLNYLKRLPIDKVKLDRTFISDIVLDPVDEAIAKAVVSLARLLKLKVVVEGVETSTQFVFLRKIECDFFQGFLFSKPVPFESILKLLHDGSGYLRLPDITPAQERSQRTVVLTGEDCDDLEILENALSKRNTRVLRAVDIHQTLEVLVLEQVDEVMALATLVDGAATELFARMRHLYPEVGRVLVGSRIQRQACVDSLNEGEIQMMIPSPVTPAWVRSYAGQTAMGQQHH